MKSGLACVVVQAVHWTTPKDAVYIDAMYTVTALIIILIR